MRFSVWRSEPNGRASGSSAATPVLLLHGVPQTAAMWQHLAAELSSDRVVLARICPGSGAVSCADPTTFGLWRPASPHSACTGRPGRSTSPGTIGVARSRWFWPGRIRTWSDGSSSSTPHIDLLTFAAWHIPAFSVPLLPEAAFRLAGPALVHRLIAYGWRSALPLDDALAAHYQAAYADPRRVSAMLGYYRDNFRPRAARAVGARAGRVLAYRSRPSRRPGRRRPAVGRRHWWCGARATRSFPTRFDAPWSKTSVTARAWSHPMPVTSFSRRHPRSLSRRSPRSCGETAMGDHGVSTQDRSPRRATDRCSRIASSPA